MPEATRPERRSFADAHDVIGAVSRLSGSLLIGGFGSLRDVDLLCSNVDQDVLPGVVNLELSAAPFVEPTADSGNLSGIETHRLTVPSAES